jgi:hypothetical protein
MSNTETVTIVEQFVQFGRVGGAGADSLLKAAMFATACVAAGHAKEGDAAELYVAYRSGFDSEVILSDNLVPDEKIKGAVSMFRTFMKKDVVKNGEIHGRAIQLREKIAQDERKAGSIYNLMLVVNRAQIKKGRVPLTNDEITAVLKKADKPESDEVTKLQALLNTAEAHHEAFGGLMEVCKGIERAIEAATARKAKEMEEDAAEEKELATEAAQGLPTIQDLAAKFAKGPANQLAA